MIAGRDAAPLVVGRPAAVMSGHCARARNNLGNRERQEVKMEKTLRSGCFSAAVGFFGAR